MLSTQWQGATTLHNKSQPLSYYKVYRQVDDFVYVIFKKNNQYAGLHMGKSY